MKSFIPYQKCHCEESSTKQSPLKVLILLLMLFNVLIAPKAFSNNLTISGVSYSYIAVGNGTVTFTLTWQNSWRNSVYNSKNWDAAWVFVKWRDCSFVPPTAQPFTHGTVSETVLDH